MKKKSWVLRPTAEYRYWLYDPSGDGMIYFRSIEERDAEAAAAVALYLDDAWDEEVEYVAMGEVTHVATQVDRMDRPEVLDEYGCDGEGTHWPEGVAYCCNYEMRPLSHEDKP